MRILTLVTPDIMIEKKTAALWIRRLQFSATQLQIPTKAIMHAHNFISSFKSLPKEKKW